jgi:hypothetical protein
MPASVRCPDWGDIIDLDGLNSWYGKDQRAIGNRVRGMGRHVLQTPTMVDNADTGPPCIEPRGVYREGCHKHTLSRRNQVGGAPQKRTRP